ncbi:MAG: preprotein translocase subunit SecA [Sulfuritalea sp.]|nr:preprotein translocase subunit SecA [Sulfuritalea sp.]
MFDAVAPATTFDEIYPELGEIATDEWLDRLGVALTGRVSRAVRSRPQRINAIVDRVNLVADSYAGLKEDALREAARELKRELRRDGLRDELVARAFALIRETAGRVLGMRHFDVQLLGGWVLINGMVAEMHTGEGKTLTATLPACAAALAGIPVHVITVNDYLVERDCELMRPIYEALGLTVAAATAEMDHRSRQAAYLADVVYCTNKTVVFDYLRDRILLGSNSSSLHLKLEKIYGADARIRRLLLRGLNFAIVDEADSVLADEARTPLIISAEASSPDEATVARQALDLAQQLVVGDDFLIIKSERRIALTETGHSRVIDLCKSLGGVWNGALRREELVTQALTALNLFVRDEHYLVRDGKVQVVDEFTGRVMADRSWGQGLHQLIETKEGCEITARREPLARISYQRFFRRYRHLSGMTGTAKEVAGELGDVYGLAVVPVPTHRPSRRIYTPDRIFETEDEKWQCVVDRVAELHAKGAPVLLGTRSVAASEVASRLLTERGVEHSVLNAKQDEVEAEIVARAGEPGRITIATNMAGRGTDIKLGPGVEELGGLHVILSERHEAGRIDRQLAGRCARQGDPGSFEAILSLEDPLVLPFKGGVFEWLMRRFTRPGHPKADAAKKRFIDFAQWRTERTQSGVRRKLLKSDKQQGDILSFSGRPE